MATFRALMVLSESDFLIVVSDIAAIARPAELWPMASAVVQATKRRRTREAGQPGDLIESPDEARSGDGDRAGRRGVWQGRRRQGAARRSDRAGEHREQERTPAIVEHDGVPRRQARRGRP